MRQRHADMRLRNFQLSSHLDTDSTAANNQHVVGRVANSMNVLARLDEVLLARQALRDNGPDTAQAGRSNEEVIAVHRGLLGYCVERGGRLGLAVDGRDGADDDFDIGLLLEGWNVGEFDPGLFGIFCISER